MKFIFWFFNFIFLVFFFIPEKLMKPVGGAKASSYNKKSFWFYPWGKSGTHKTVKPKGFKNYLETNKEYAVIDSFSEHMFSW
jgi:hypothetical protein